MWAKLVFHGLGGQISVVLKINNVQIIHRSSVFIYYLEHIEYNNLEIYNRL